MTQHNFVVRNPDFAQDIARSFGRQGALKTVSAVLLDIQPGLCRLSLPISESVSQHHGYVHGGIVGMIGDVAGGYAAMSLFEPGREILTIEYKINFLAPALGVTLQATGKVVRPGRSIAVTTVELVAFDAARAGRTIALLQQTCMPG
jgi:uncharacterized protein (TIGR00369 family)